MKMHYKLIIIHLLFVGFMNAQGSDPDASIWLNTWSSCQKRTNPITEMGTNHWIQYDFGRIRNLSKTWIWNTNAPNQLDQGFNEVRIDYSINGESWNYLGNMEFPKATGEAIYGGFSGPDMVGIKARYVLLTALSNHGHPSCSGIAEVKFNLLPDDQLNLPEECSNVVGFTSNGVKEVTNTEAIVFWEYPSDEPVEFIFQFSSYDDWEEVETQDTEIYLDGLEPGEIYRYKVVTYCEDIPIYSDAGFFLTLDENNVACSGQGFNETNVEMVTETEVLLNWEFFSEDPYFIVEIRQQGGDWLGFEAESYELLLEGLQPGTDYEYRVIYQCGETQITSNTGTFATLQQDGTVSTHKKRLLGDKLILAPNPTRSFVTLNYYAQAGGPITYRVIHPNGQVLSQQSVNVTIGKNTVQLDLSNYPNGVYTIKTISQNYRDQFIKKVVKLRE